METEKILTYLSDLDVNNNRDWYHAHKKQSNSKIVGD